MDRERVDEAGQSETGEEIEKQAEKSRRALDDIPAPGTDPLHEGP
jgi:hypothetical protein